ncbi:hypothetical protein LEN26_003800 [Aphanomyces euteiches]|nr:hypothetical protein LEN26_003800 [Aphanomyces euteiches]KAH9186848.1 hypothetical protein AeNC1_011175 [Aphanomyces euteiches]
MRGPTTLAQPPISVPHSPRPSAMRVPSTVILLDWDDTLFPNAYLSTKGYSIDDFQQPLTKADEALMDRLTQHIQIFLLACKDAHRTVWIVTNGEDGWVERSCKRFMPCLYPLVTSLRIVSARALYEAKCPMQEWKTACFVAELKQHFSSDVGCETRHIVSIGDSQYERQAIQVVPTRLPRTKTKSVKLVDQPTIVDMVRQLKLLSTYLSHLCSHPDHLDLILSREVLRDISI